MHEILDILTGGQEHPTYQEVENALEKFEDLKQDTRNLELLLSTVDMIGQVGRFEVLDYFVENIIFDYDIEDRENKVKLVKDCIINQAGKSYGSEEFNFYLYLILLGEERRENSELIETPSKTWIQNWLMRVNQSDQNLLFFWGHEEELVWASSIEGYGNYIRQLPPNMRKFREKIEIDSKSFKNIVSLLNNAVYEDECKASELLRLTKLNGESSYLLAIRDNKDLFLSRLQSQYENDWKYWKKVLEEEVSEKSAYHSWKAALRKIEVGINLFQNVEEERSDILKELPSLDLRITLLQKIRVGLLASDNNFDSGSEVGALEPSIQKELENEISQRLLDDENPNPILEEILKLKNPVRSSIISDSLGKIASENRDRTALILIGRYGDNEQLPFLRTLDPSFLTLSTLGEIGTEESFVILLENLDKAIVNRSGSEKQICQTFGKCKTKSAQETMIRVITDGFPFDDDEGKLNIEIRKYACYAIALSGNHDFIPLLEKCLEIEEIRNLEAINFCITRSKHVLLHDANPKITNKAKPDYVLMSKPDETFGRSEGDLIFCACGQRFKSTFALNAHCRKQDGRDHYPTGQS